MHSTFLLRMEYIARAGTVIQIAMDRAEQGRQKEANRLINETITEILEGNVHLEYAAELAEAAAQLD